MKLALTLSGSGATLDKSRVFRHLLWRVWEPEAEIVHFCMLNPSNADENKNDPTIRKCRGFAERWGYGGFVVTNLRDYRATSPVELMSARRSESGANPMYVRTALECYKTVVAWGALGWRFDANVLADFALDNGRKLYCLGETKNGSPKHPLYVPYTAKLREWNAQ